jgi:ribosomal protein L16/L10AE
MRAAESRMGSGKGHLNIGLQSLNRENFTKSQALTKLLLVTLYTNAGHKMPVKTQIVIK